LAFDEQLLPVEPPRKFQHKYVLHIILFVVTLGTTTFAGGLHYAGFLVSQGLPEPTSIHWPSFFFQGLTYSIPVLLILGAHEFGHYFYCRKHHVDATLPYFLPAPVPLTGTFGGVIRIKERFPSVRALFDIGVAGPIAGFVVLVPFLYWGLTLSKVVRFPEGEDLIYFGEPLILQAIAAMHFGTIPEGYDLTLHPLGFAAWLGMFATALNLLPFGQLDGGHIAYAVFGRHSRWISLGTLAATVLLTIRSTSWISMAIIMLIMAFFLGVGHPQIEDEGTALDTRRKLIAFFALIMFVLCFTPVPIELFFSAPTEAK
jgi:membrane-associated protease RseP (regulator of RpoE activity)